MLVALAAGCAVPTDDGDSDVREKSLNYGVPIEISTLAQLRSMYGMNDYVLTSDIDASATQVSGNEFVPIGNGRLPFLGTFDGGGHVISNLKIVTKGGNTGIFGHAAGAVISNVGLVNVTVVGRTNTGALVGVGSDTQISDCYAEGTVTAVSGGPWYGFGLLAGSLGGLSRIDRSYAIGSISGNIKEVGGVVGLLNGDWATGDGIAEVFADVDIVPSFGAGSYPVAAGGIVGVIVETNVLNVHSRGEVIGDYSGGIIGTVRASQSGADFNLLALLTNAVVTVHNVPGRTGAVGRWETGSGFCRTAFHNTTTDGGSLPSGSPGCAIGYSRSVLQNPGPNLEPFSFGTDGTWDLTAWNFNGANQYPTLRNIPNASTVQPLKDPGQ